MSNDYTIKVTRDGAFWFIDIPQIDGATQARRLDEVEEMARDYISEYLEIPAETIHLTISYELPALAQVHLDEALRLRADELAARAQASREYRAAAKTLSDEGLTLREIGALLDVSYQRAQQLVSS